MIKKVGKKKYAVFISYYPLKQGLKPNEEAMRDYYEIIFISYYPLKQGLKRSLPPAVMSILGGFISYYPLKQGLKQTIQIDGYNYILNLYPTIH